MAASSTASSPPLLRSPTPSSSLAEEEAVAVAAAGRSRAVTPAAAPLPAARSPAYVTAATFFSAGMGNVLSAVCTNPADVIKVRQQLLKSRGRGPSFLAVAAGMVKGDGGGVGRGGILSLWSGVTASCLREATYSTIRMGGYEPLKRFYSSQGGALADCTFANKLLAGITSGALGAALSSPTDLLKIRMQAARPPPDCLPPYKTTFHGFVEVYRKEGGLKGLWRGVYPNTIRAAVLTSSQIATYDEVKGWFKRTFAMQEGLGLHFSASMVAGFVCSAASQPIDTIKVRLMSRAREVGGTSAARAGGNAFHLLGDLLRNEGPLALWKGFGMCWARLGSHTVVSLILFEAFRGALGIKPL